MGEVLRPPPTPALALLLLVPGLGAVRGWVAESGGCAVVGDDEGDGDVAVTGAGAVAGAADAAAAPTVALAEWRDDLRTGVVGLLLVDGSPGSSPASSSLSRRRFWLPSTIVEAIAPAAASASLDEGGAMDEIMSAGRPDSVTRPTWHSSHGSPAASSPDS